MSADDGEVVVEFSDISKPEERPQLVDNNAQPERSVPFLSFFLSIFLFFQLAFPQFLLSSSFFLTHVHSSSGQKRTDGWWEWVIFFNGLNPPKDKKGNDFPDGSKAVLAWKNLQQQRKDLLHSLFYSQIGLIVDYKKSEDGSKGFILISCEEQRLLEQAEKIEFQMKLKVR
jgi:hypothetical protein